MTVTTLSRSSMASLEMMTVNFQPSKYPQNWFPKKSLTDDDDDDEEFTPAAQPAQQATQQIAQSPVSADVQPSIIADEAVADNIDDIGSPNIDGELADTGAKDPQQAAQDQAATINNTIDPVGNEAIVDDDEDGKSRRFPRHPIKSPKNHS